ncbi:MAG: hypothetical protein V1784_11390, partial [bacterium]
MTNIALAGDVRLQTYPLPSAQKAGRGYIFSANEVSFFYGTTATMRDNPFMGLTVAGERLFDDVRLWCGSQLVDRAEAKADVWAQGASFSTDSITFVLDFAKQDFLRVLALSKNGQRVSLELVLAPNALNTRQVRQHPDAVTIAPPENGRYVLAIAWPSEDVLRNRAREMEKLPP